MVYDSQMHTKQPTLSDSSAEIAPLPRSQKERQANIQVESVELIRGDQLDTKLAKTWRTIASQANLIHPYYHPEFSRAVTQVREDIEIAILRGRSGTTLGFFPFQRETNRYAAPIGGRMNDFQALILPSHVSCRLDWLLEQLGVDRLSFHAWDRPRKELERFTFETLDSYYVDLTEGYDSYMKWLCQHSSTIKRLPQKTRALQRDVGEIRFEFLNADPKALEDLISLKRKKFQRTNTFDILSVDWAANLIREISTKTEDEFRGVLSVLWAGKQMVAAQFGMMNQELLHYWFPAYDPEFAKYSPGLQLMLQSCQAAARHGLYKIDMSYGESRFKDKFCNAKSKVAAGVIDHRPHVFFASKQKYFFRKKLKSIPLKEALKFGLRRVFPGYGKWHFK